MSPPASSRHIPVLLAEVMSGLAPVAGDTHVDGTFGAGGYTSAILATGARVIAFDRDPDAIAGGASLVAAAAGQLELIRDRFSRMDRALAERDVAGVDGVTLDIGVSSMQIDRAERGFSFQADGPLDMRMSQDGQTAAEFLNEAEEGEIADVIFHLGDEPQSRRIARTIVAARPLSRTGELAAIVRKAVGARPGQAKDPATRTFQAIRIHLNAELDELQDGLAAAERVLKAGGRLAVVTFHSAEDRIVKGFLRARSGATPTGSRHLPVVSVGPSPSFDQVAKPVRAAAAEIGRNPRARSATLRVAHRTSAQPWPRAAGGSAR